jgi:hypothetical protein
VAAGRGVPLHPPVLRTIAPISPQPQAPEEKVAAVSLS